tara:strand:- start:196 stop:1011 length:816 start_codon:yes stop_codon:yes gene_type:complete
MSEEAIQESGSQEVASDTSTVSFHDTLPENLRTSPSMLKFKDVSGLAQGYVNLEQAFGGDKVAKPTDSWTDEQYNDFYAQIGRPEDINGYHIEGAEGDEETWNSYKQAAYDAGLSGKQAQKMAEFLTQTAEQANEAHDENVDSIRQQTRDLITKEFGAATKQRVQMANQAAAKYGMSDLLEEVELANGTVLGDVPEIIMMFAQLAEDIGEDTLVGEASDLIMTPDEARRKRTELMMSGPYQDKFHPEHDWYVQEVQRHFQLESGNLAAESG